MTPPTASVTGTEPDAAPRSIRRPILVASAVAIAMVAGACSESSDYVYVEPATVEQVDAELWRVELTQSAAERTGIETADVVTETIDGVERLVIPYSAVMYHFDGTTWTYVNPDGLLYQRAPIDIEYIEGDRAVLTAGPPPGSSVVSVGAAELYGVEFGIGK